MRNVLPALFVSAVLGCATASGATARAAAPSASKARTGKLTAEMLVGLRSVSDVAISPDSKQIAYVVRTPRRPDEQFGRARNVIWVVAAGGGEPRRFTSAQHSSWRPTWSPDGKHLAFLSKRGDVRQVYAAPRDGGEAQQLTQSPTTVSRFAYAPSGAQLAYTASFEDTPQEAKAKEEGRDWHESDVHGTSLRLWTLDLESYQRKAVTNREQSILDFEWSPNGNRIAMRLSARADVDATMMYGSLYVTDVADRKLWLLAKTAGKLADFAWSPDGTQIAFLGANDLHDPTAGVLFVAPSTGGKARPLTAGYEATGQWVEWLDAKSLALMANEGTRSVFSRIEVASGKRKALGGTGPICRSPDISKDTKRLACAGNTPSHPGEVFVGAARRGPLKRLTVSNPELEGTRLGRQEVVRWKAADGLEIEGIVIRPADYTKGKRYPLAILPHGGPEGISLDGWNSRATYPAQLFAAHGYVVLEPNYRGSAGRGVAYGKADQKDLGGKEFEDVLAGIDHLAAQGLIDPARVGMGGWSYGGYFSGLAATKHSKRFKAAMVGAAITNWMSFTGTSEIEHENSLVHWNLWPYDAHELVWSRSPMAHTKGSKTATLVVHGLDDTRVPPGQAFELHRALRYHGAKTQLVTYPREGHGLSENAHQLDFAKRFVAWFDDNV